ncbi:MAG: hypothetical protein MJE66_12700 [Proteobacteria bacterium]|nr:hypothetical protein [Pseudomonadota bacterium]
MSAAALIAAVGGLSFVLASWVLGPRLILLSRRTHGRPEFSIGLGLLLMAGVGYPLTAVAELGTGLAHSTRMTLLVLSMVAGAVGQCSVTLFTRQVFRPDARWAGALMLFLLLAFPVAFALQAGSPGFETLLNGRSGPWSASQYLSTLNIGWAGTESFLYWRRLKKRQRLGLADPIVTNRIGLWALAILSSTTISVTTTLLHLVDFGLSTGQEQVVKAIVIGPLGAVSSVGLWLAFLPPFQYTDWVKRRAGARGA